MRAMIEPYLLRYAVKNISAEQVANLGPDSGALAQDKAVKDWAGSTSTFTARCSRRRASRWPCRYWTTCWSVRDRYLKLQNFRSSTTREESDTQHGQILKCVKSGDVEGAVAALTKHIRWNANDVKHPLAIPKSAPGGQSHRRVRRGLAARTLRGSSREEPACGLSWPPPDPPTPYRRQRHTAAHAGWRDRLRDSSPVR